MSGGKGFFGRLTTAVRAPTDSSRAWFLVRAATGLHAAIFRASRGRLLNRFDDAPLLVLHHRGAKSGTLRTTPLIYLEDGQNLVIVASMGGQPKNPAWYHNLRAHPQIEIDVGGRRRRVTARLATQAEAERLWPRLSAMWPAWEDYKTRTDREFPVFVLEPR